MDVWNRYPDYVCAQDILPFSRQFVAAGHIHFLDDHRCQELEQLILITTVSEKLVEHFPFGGL